MSKIKGIQDKETFTRTKCTSTVVIYKYSSPSSFQLSENKKSKFQEQFKDPITAILEGRYNRTNPQGRCVTLSTLFTGLYKHTDAICSLRFTLQRSKTRASNFSHGLCTTCIRSHTDMHAIMHACETAQAHTLLYLYTLTSNTHILTHTHTHFQLKCCLLKIATKALRGVRSDIVRFYQSASSSM